MRTEKKRHAVESLFVLVIFAVFLAASLLAVMIGARVYTRVVDDSGTHGETRTAFAYLANKVRGGDSGHAVRLETQGGMDVLVLEERYGEQDYRTYIYRQDGSLKELFAPADAPFNPQLGEPVADTGPLAFQLNGQLLSIEQTQGERPLSLHLKLTS